MAHLRMAFAQRHSGMAGKRPMMSNIALVGSLSDQRNQRMQTLQSRMLWHSDSPLLPVPAPSSTVTDCGTSRSVAQSTSRKKDRKSVAYRTYHMAGYDQSAVRKALNCHAKPDFWDCPEGGSYPKHQRGGQLGRCNNAGTLHTGAPRNDQQRGTS